MNDVVLRKPSAAMTAVRVLLITVMATLICFAVALFFGIVGFGFANLAGRSVSMGGAYRDVGLPVAVVGFVVAAVTAFRSESRRYRRARAEYLHRRHAA